MRTYRVTLGTLDFTSGHCHRCAQLQLDVEVRAADRNAAVVTAMRSVQGRHIELQVPSVDGQRVRATLIVQDDDSLLTNRSVRVEELD